MCFASVCLFHGKTNRIGCETVPPTQLVDFRLFHWILVNLLLMTLICSPNVVVVFVWLYTDSVDLSIQFLDEHTSHLHSIFDFTWSHWLFLNERKKKDLISLCLPVCRWSLWSDDYFCLYVSIGFSYRELKYGENLACVTLRKKKYRVQVYFNFYIKI